MFKKINFSKIGTFAIALMIGVTMGYVRQSHAGIVADMFKEPISDFTSLITEDLGNTMALLGVIIALGVAAFYQSIMTAVMGVIGVAVIWSTMEYFA